MMESALSPADAPEGQCQNVSLMFLIRIRMTRTHCHTFERWHRPGLLLLFRFIPWTHQKSFGFQDAQNEAGMQLLLFFHERAKMTPVTLDQSGIPPKDAQRMPLAA
jgi:hypothetical protein